MKALVKFIAVIFAIALIAGVIYTLKSERRKNVEVKTIVISDQNDSLAVEKIYVKNLEN